MSGIPVIDLFAGPGGLGEGFSQEPQVDFRIAVSIEKDAMAFQTLRLRAAFRELRRLRAPEPAWQIWDRIIAETPWGSTFEELSRSSTAAVRAACKTAQNEALNLELGPRNRSLVSTEIRKCLLPHMHKGGRLPRNIVLIGGPPCQAYSVVGRSRNKGTLGYKPEADHRHFLYLEYLHVIGEFEPAVFVMENVKGLLTSKIHESQIFETIRRDLKRPGIASGSGSKAEYVLCALSGHDSLLEEPTAEDFIIRAEEHGVPQARHRVIILGVRKDVFEAAQGVGTLARLPPPTVWDVLSDIPPLRPRLSFRGNGLPWLQAFQGVMFDSAIRELRRDRLGAGQLIADRMMLTRDRLKLQDDPGPGSDRFHLSRAAQRKQPRALAGWFHDRQSGVLANHECRAHMPSDLVRYLFVATFGEITKASPRLQDFPKCLLPEHRNVDRDNVGDSIFKDRFRVQLADQCSMTVTSHIAKDGHAFIHPQPIQCRSLTVREAARLQTFPDSYVFLGNRTSQYTQVGNAVPPYLAVQIAGIVADTLARAGLTGASADRGRLAKSA